MAQVASKSLCVLMTDIESSTRIWEIYPKQMSHDLSIHDAVVKDTIKEYDGDIFKSTGDGVIAVFHDVQKAIESAIIIQKKLSNEKWKNQIGLKVRIAIHYGKIETRLGDYFGPGINLCSRILSITNGGQIIISEDVHKLATTTSKKLGSFKLKGIFRDINLFQVNEKIIEKEFPQINISDENINNLPVYFTSFIGRNKEVKEINRSILENRVTTLLGPGGNGKTRLAVETCRLFTEEFSDGIWFVDLSNANSIDKSINEIETCLQIESSTKHERFANIVDFLKDKRLLVILDNCEQLMPEIANKISTLIKSSSNVKILVTSREKLAIQGENIIHVLSFSYPESGSMLTENQILKHHSVKLFIDRARSSNPNLKIKDNDLIHIAEICKTLEGMPLAIELIAPLTLYLSLEQIVKKITESIDTIASEDPTIESRHKTLMNTIKWSYDLLPEHDKEIFRACSFFMGGFNINAFEYLSQKINGRNSALESLRILINKSLIVPYDAQSGRRYRMMEPVRHIALQFLNEKNENYEVNQILTEYYASLVSEYEDIMKGSQQDEAIRLLSDEHYNLMNAIRFSATSDNNSGVAPNMVVSLLRYWRIYGNPKEILDLILLVNENDKNMTELEKARLINMKGVFELYTGKFDDAEKSFLESLEIRKLMNDDEGIASLYNNLGLLYSSQNKLNEAMDYFKIALDIYESVGNKTNIANLYANIGALNKDQSNFDEAEKFLTKSLNIYTEIGDILSKGVILHNLGQVAFEKRQYEKAKELYDESMKIRKATRDIIGESAVLNSLAALSLELNKPEESAGLLGASDALMEKAQTPLTGREIEEHEVLLKKIKDRLPEKEFIHNYEKGKESVEKV